jgi:hypothetical protein
MSTFTDRYVAAVLAGIPQNKKADVERELRSSIADAIDDRVGGGEGAENAERHVLQGLGDPARMSAEMTGRPMYLIGPDLFPAYRALLGLLLAIVPAIVGVVAAVASLSGGGQVGDIIVAGVGAAFNVAVHLGFWVTLIFALIERFDTAKQATGELRSATGAWTVESLPEVQTGRVSIGDTVGESFGNIAAIVGLLVLQAITWTDPQTGQANPLLEPSVSPVLVPYLVAIMASLIGFRVVLYMVGRWTVGLAAANAVLNLAFTIPVVYLALNGMLINPAFAQSIGWPELASGSGWAMLLTAAIATVVTAWEIFDGFRQALRASALDAGASNTPT